MRRSVQEPFSKLVLIGSDDTASGESIELMMRSNGYAALLLTHLYSYDEIIETATGSGPDLVICYGSLHDEPAIKHLYGIRAPLIVISAHPPSFDGPGVPCFKLLAPFHKDQLDALVERALKGAPD
jgi:hypothetical protein